jgi:hypothetical protein
MPNRPVIIPELIARIVLQTDLTLQEVTNQVSLALGIIFHNDTEGLYEEIDAQVAYTIGHIFGIYEKKKNIGKQCMIFLELRPNLYPTDLGLELNECTVVDLDIDNYLALFLQTKTGLPFETVRPTD